MRNFIKNRLKWHINEHLKVSNEIGGLEDIEIVDLLKYQPYIQILNQVKKDWGGESDLYAQLLTCFINNKPDVKQLISVLKNFDVFDSYSHFLNLNEALVKKSEVDKVISDLNAGIIFGNHNFQFVKRADGIMFRWDINRDKYTMYNDLRKFANAIVRFVKRGY